MSSIQRLHVGPRLAEIVIHGNTVYLAGEVPDDGTKGITEQTEQVLAKIDKLLKQVARRVEETILAKLQQRGVTTEIRFSPKLKEQGLLDLKP